MKTWSDFGIQLPSNARGPEVDTTCPECSATRKHHRNARCLSVNIDAEVWICHHCGWNGTLKTGTGQRYESPTRTHYAKPRIHRLTPLPEKIIAWFYARGIPERVLATHRIGWGEMYFGELESQAWCVQFPYYRNGELINVKYRTLDKRFRMATGAERILYGLDEIQGNKTLIWVEGEMDRLSVDVAGFTACVSVPDGAPDAKSQQYESKFNFLQSAETQLTEIETHILAVDNDANGLRLEYELSRRLGVEKCRRVVWPDGCKDANDVLVKHGAQQLALCIDGAEPYPVEGLLRVDDVARDAWRIYEQGWQKGCSTGWPNIDEHYTIKPGQVTIVSGMPMHGKSSWTQDLLVNLARLHGWPCAIFSPEDAPNERLITAMAQRYTQQTIWNGHPQRMGASDFGKALDWLNTHVYILNPEEKDQEATLDIILNLARMAVLRHGIKALCLDPWNEIEHQRPPHMTESEYVGQSLKRIRTFSRKHGVHTWVIAHPTKLYRGDDGNYPVPTLYDISGSANFRNKADCGVVIYRRTIDHHDEVEVHVQKIKFREVGKPGMVKLHYHQTTGRFSNETNLWNLLGGCFND